MEKPDSANAYFCNKCGYIGRESRHPNCDYFACKSVIQQWADYLEAENARLREELAAAQLDAARYRYLRSNPLNLTDDIAISIRFGYKQLDNAIDEAMK